jgi:hypothetical protein
METLAAWVPTTPEMEVKILLGEHVWDAAQHADALGKRTSELRMPLQHRLSPVDEYEDFLNEIANLKDTKQRLAAIYDVLLPGLMARYHRYLEQTDSLSDAPTVRILERHLHDVERMIEANSSMQTEIPELQLADTAWAKALQDREASINNLIAAKAEAVAMEA